MASCWSQPRSSLSVITGSWVGHHPALSCIHPSTTQLLKFNPNCPASEIVTSKTGLPTRLAHQACPPGLPTCAYPFFAWEARPATRQLENVKIFLDIIWNSEIKTPQYLVAILELDYLIAIWISWFLTKISEAHGKAMCLCKSFVVIFIIAAFTFFWYINYPSFHPSIQSLWPTLHLFTVRCWSSLI